MAFLPSSQKCIVSLRVVLDWTGPCCFVLFVERPSLNGVSNIVAHMHCFTQSALAHGIYTIQAVRGHAESALFLETIIAPLMWCADLMKSNLCVVCRALCILFQQCSVRRYVKYLDEQEKMDAIDHVCIHPRSCLMQMFYPRMKLSFCPCRRLFTAQSYAAMRIIT